MACKRWPSLAVGAAARSRSGRVVAGRDLGGRDRGIRVARRALRGVGAMERCVHRGCGDIGRVRAHPRAAVRMAGRATRLRRGRAAGWAARAHRRRRSARARARAHRSGGRRGTRTR